LDVGDGCQGQKPLLDVGLDLPRQVGCTLPPYGFAKKRTIYRPRVKKWKSRWEIQVPNISGQALLLVARSMGRDCAHQLKNGKSTPVRLTS
jgi:hypothetical protein